MGRFFSLVDAPEHREEFKRYYRIPSNVSMQHCNPGEWHEKRPTSVVVIPMIAFIEGGMRIPMGRVTRDFLNIFRLCPIQCVPNMFIILGCVDALNEKFGICLTHHNVNWVYSCQKGVDGGNFLKTRAPAVRLISCLPKTNKCMDGDFLIVSGEWHDRLHCLTKDGTRGGVA